MAIGGGGGVRSAVVGKLFQKSLHALVANRGSYCNENEDNKKRTQQLEWAKSKGNPDSEA